MQKNIYKLITGILTALILASCAGAAPTENANVVMTGAVETMVAAYFETQTALVTPVTSTSLPTLTEVSFPTITPFSPSTPFALASATFIYHTPTLGSITPTGTQATATINPFSLAAGCNNLYFIRDVTMPAGTVLQKNVGFTKTWKVQNTGTCDWLYQYDLVLLSGDSFGSQNKKLQKLVKVGDWTELSVGGITPNKAGKYTSYWRLSSGGTMFGATLAISFEVKDPPTSTPVPTITNTPSMTPTPTSTFTPSPTPTFTDTPSPTPTFTNTPPTP